MSRKRDRNKSKDCNCPDCQKKTNSGLVNSPFGINPSQLMGMLGNIDMGQVGNILSSMNTDGFDLNNVNLGSIQKMMSGMNVGNGFNGGANNQDISSIQKMMSGMGMKENQGLSSIQDMIANMGNLQGKQNNMNNRDVTNIDEEKYNDRDRGRNINNKKNRNKENITAIEVDENIEMLMSIKKIVNYDRARFIDKVIELYNEGVFEDY